MNKKLVKICVFDKNSTPGAVITGNGDEILDNICISAISDEIFKTAEYYLDAVFLIDEEGLHNSINEEAILKVQLDYGNEYFRIAKALKTSRDITVFARQITISETLDMWIEDVRPENQNGQGAISWIKDNSIGKKDINVYSDIQNTSTSYYMDMSMYEALHTSDNSFLERWGGEVQRRGYNLYINNHIGTHRGVQIRSNKNLTGFEASTNIDNIVTRIKPKGYDGITIPGFVDSPLINKYSSIKTKEIKYEDVKVKSENDDEGYNTLEEAQAELIRRAKLEFTQNHIDELRGEYRVNFVQLEQTEEYKNYVAAERVFLGDYVDVYEEKLGIDITVRAIRKQYDILRQKVIEVELSNNTESKKTPTINQVLNKIEEVKESNKWFEEAINNATDLIENGLKDSYVVHRKNEILIMDTTDINTATNVWRWNSGGLAHSSTGYYGKYSTAITQDGGIVATMISSGILNANLIKTGVIRNHNNDFEINLDDGTIKIKNNNFKVVVDGEEQGIVSQSEFKQTKDRIDMQVKYAGNGNLVPLGKPNSSNWFKGWTIDENTQVYWSSSTNFAFMKKSVGQGSANLKTIVMSVKQNTYYSFQCDIAKESNVSSCVINIHCQNKEFSDIAMYKAIETSYTGEQHIQYTFETPIDCEYVYFEYVYWHRNGEENSVIWVDNVQINLGEAFYPAYNPNIENIHNAVVSVFNEGIEIRQEDGSKAIYTGYKIAFTDTNGNDGLRIVDGGLVFNDQTTGEYMGFIHSTTRKDIEENINGITIASPLNGDYINFCDTNSMDPYDFETGLRDYMIIWTARNTFNDTFPSNAIYMLKELVCRDNTHFDGNVYVKADAEFSRKVKFKAGLTTDGDITIPQGCSLDLQGGNFLNTSQYGQAMLCGSQILRLCNRVDNGYVKEMLVIANGYGVECYGVLNMHGNAIINAASVYDLNTASRSIDSVLNDLSKENFAEIVEDDKLKVDLAELNKTLYARNKALEKENEKLMQQQFEQDEMIIENAFAIANIELGGL